MFPGNGATVSFSGMFRQAALRFSGQGGAPQFQVGVMTPDRGRCARKEFEIWDLRFWIPHLMGLA